MGMCQMRCKLCGISIVVRVRDGDQVFTGFCTPEHAYEWQRPLTELQIIEETSGFGMPYHRCQWCGCTLKSGYHEKGCLVRTVYEEHGK